MQRRIGSRLLLFLLGIISPLGVLLWLVLSGLSQSALAATGINEMINFQGKVVNTDGTNVTNGSYSFVFCFYTASAPATPCTSGANNDAVWRDVETLTVTNGVFQYNLGSDVVLPGSVNFNTDNIYLGVGFNGDPQMSPTIRMTAVPQAFNSDLWDGLDAVNLSQGEVDVLDSGITESEVTGEIEAVTAGNGLTGGGSADSVTLNIVSGNAGIVANADDITLTLPAAENGLSTTTTSGSGLEIIAAKGLTLLQGCAEGQILKWDEDVDDRWECQNDNSGGSADLATTYNNGAAGDQVITFDSTQDSLIFRNPDGGSDSNYILTLDQLATTGTHGGLSIQSAGTGNLLLVTDTTATARDVLTIADTGVTTFRNQTNSTSALQVQNSLGSVALAVDTTARNSNITNPSIEQSISGNWAARGAGVTVAQTSSEAYAGSNSLSVDTNNNTNDGAYQTLPVTLAASTTYTISWHAMRDGTAFTDMIAAFSYDGTVGNDSSCTGMVSQTVYQSNWAKYSCQFATGSGGTAPTSSNTITIKQTAAADRVFYIDGVQLEALSAATPFKETALNLHGSLVARDLISTSGSGLFIYGTNDQTTNWERLEMGYMTVSPGSSSFQIRANKAGTGAARILDFYYGGTSSQALRISTAVDNGIQFAIGSTSTVLSTGRVVISGTSSATSGNNLGLSITTSYAPSSASTMVAIPLNIAPTINYSAGGTGSYEGLRINVTETALPDGPNYLFRAGTGGGSFTSKFNIDNSGNALNTGYTRIGSTTAPLNTTAGDLTATRLMVGTDTALSTSPTLANFKQTTTTTSTSNNMAQLLYLSNPSSNSSAIIRAFVAENQVPSSNTVNFTSGTGLIGFASQVTHNGSGTVSSIIGANMIGAAYGSVAAGGAITNVSGLMVQPVLASASTGAVSTARGLRLIDSALGPGPISITSQAGLSIDAISAATNNTSILIGTTGVPAGNFAIHSTSTNDSYLAGDLGIGDSSPDATVDIDLGTTVNTQDLLAINNSASTGTVTSGVDGLQIDFKTGTATSPTNSGLTINLTSGGDAVGDILNGIDLTLASATSGTDNGIRFGANFDTDITTTSNTNLTISAGGTGDVTLVGDADTDVVFSGLTIDITTGSNETLIIAPNGSGDVVFNTDSDTALSVNNSAGNGIVTVNTLTTNNLIPNASFEQNIHGWAAKATPTGGTPLWDNTASNAHSGGATLKLSTDAAADGVQFNFPLKSSTGYTFSFYAKVSSGSQDFVIGRQDNGSSDTDCAGTITITTSYQQFSCSFTTGTASGNPNVYIKQSGAGTPTVFMDSVTFVESGTALPYIFPASHLQIDTDLSNISLNAAQDADIQPWQLNSNANSLPSGRRGATTVTANSYIYFIGGTTANGSSGAPVTTVNYAKIMADGSIGSWSAAAQTLPVALYGHSSIVANGYVYVIGGCSDSSTTAACTTPVSTVYYSKLNSDGTVGAWQTNAVALGVPAGAAAARGFGSAVFSNGYVYYLGGYNSTAQTAVYSGKLGADGSIAAWVTTGVTALGSGRYGHTTINVNSQIYSIGGCSDAGATCDTAITTVESAAPANDGTLGSWTAATSLPTATGFHTSSILNGYIFNVGGRQAAAVVGTAYYSKVNSSGALGIWTTSLYPLPSPHVRQQASSLFVNSYIYNLGGFDGTATIPTSIHYASGARVSVFGGLDLVSLSGQTLSDYAGAGNLTAGNTRVVGDIRIDGNADLNNGLSVDSVINLNAISSDVGQSVFNINNSSSNAIFNVKHMNTNFGALAYAGAFANINSYWAQEFNNWRLSGTCADALNAIGDGGAQATACTAGNGPISVGVTLSGTASCTSSTLSDGLGGVGRMAAADGNGVGSCLLFLGTNTAADGNMIFNSDNLPVVTMKIKPSTACNQSGNSNSRCFFGIGNLGTASSGASSDAQTAMDTSDSGIYFSNCSAPTTPTCTSTTWQATLQNGASISTVNCAVNISNTQFAYFRIEVLVSGATPTVRAYVDGDVSNGVTPTACPVFSGVGIANLAWYWFADIDAESALNGTSVLDIDYIRIWQDDAPTTDTNSEIATTGSENQTTVSQQTAEPPISLDASSATAASNSFFDFLAATSEDAIFDKDVYVKGTLYADKIKANQIEGLAVLTDKVGSLQAQLDKEKATEAEATGQTSSPNSVDTTIQADIKDVTGINLIALAQIESRGGLIVDGEARFKGKSVFMAMAEFYGQAQFKDDVAFGGNVSFNNSFGGKAIIKKGAKQVEVKFIKPYHAAPIITASYNFEGEPAAALAKQQSILNTDYHYLISQVTKDGFIILLDKLAEEDIGFSWLAASVNEPITTESSVLTPESVGQL